MVHALVQRDRLAADVLAALQPPTGVILPFSGSSVPAGFLLCDGGSYSTSTYNALFLTIGYAFGGSGSSFNVPDCRGRTLIGSGSGPGLTPRVFASLGGSYTHGNSSDGASLIHTAVHTHTNSSHSHTFPSHVHTISTDGSHYHTSTGFIGGTSYFTSGGSNTTTNGGHDHGGTSSYAGGTTDAASVFTGPDPSMIFNSANNTNPYMVINYMIKV